MTQLKIAARPDFPPGITKDDTEYPKIKYKKRGFGPVKGSDYVMHDAGDSGRRFSAQTRSSHQREGGRGGRCERDERCGSHGM